MALNKELLDILCCPETKQDVELVTGETVDALNKKVAAGTLTNRGGETVTEKIDAVLMREDRQYCYPIRQDIPIMLIDEAIPCDQIDG